MIIRKADKSRAGLLAGLHEQNIETGLFSALGRPFLKLLYEELVASDQVICLVAEENGSVIGFICGCENLPVFYRAFISHSFFSVSGHLLRKIYRPGILRGILETLRYARKFEGPVHMPPAELISIAVNSGFRSKGVGANLVVSLAKEFDKRSVPDFTVIVGSSLLAANAFYKKMGFEPVGTIKINSDDISNIFFASTDKLLKRRAR